MQGCKVVPIILGMMLLFCASGDAVARQMSLALQWTPQAQFAGYYVALEKGFYKDAGLDLRIESGGADMLSSARLESGSVDFATMFIATALGRYDDGVPVVNIAQYVRHSALLIVTKKDAGYKKLEDLDHIKVATWGAEFQSQGRGLFEQHNLTVQSVPANNPVELFLRGAVQGTMAMWYNEYHTLLNYGLKASELQVFFFKDTDFDFPEDGIYCLRSTLETHPQAAATLVEQTNRGWQYAFEHPEEALDIVEKYMSAENIPLTRVHQRWMLEKMKALIVPQEQGANQLGSLSEPAFAKTVQALKSAGIIDQAVNYDDFHRDPRHVQ